MKIRLKVSIQIQIKLSDTIESVRIVHNLP